MSGKNVAHSVSVRLLQRARAEGVSYELLLLRYGAERLLYRLSQSAAADQFLLKGACLFLVWNERTYRPTRDVDLLGYGNPDPAALVTLFHALCSEDQSYDDGLRFLPDSVRAEQIKEEQEYEGVRIRLRALLQNARIELQVDIGFGDVVVPPAVEADFPTLLDMPAPRLRMYPMEAVFAEKLQTIVSRSLANSRLKDYVDLWMMIQSGIRETLLMQAIRSTFNHRGTAIPKKLPPGLSPTFARNPARIKQWKALCQRVSIDICPSSLQSVVSDVARYVTPLFAQITAE